MKFDIYSGVLEPKQPKQRRECIANAFDNSKLIEQLAIRVDATHTLMNHMPTLTNFDLFLII